MSTGESAQDRGPVDTVAAHIAAFNARDVPAVVQTFAEDAVFANADDIVVGHNALTVMFRDAFESPMRATLELRRAVLDGDDAACELVERIAYGGTTFDVELAGFFTVRDGRVVRARIYRESAP